MREKFHLIPERQLRLYEEMRKRHLGWMVLLGVAALIFGAATVTLHGRLVLDRTAEAESYDPVHDSLMQEFYAVRDDPHLRRYLIAKIKGLAAEHDVDADLLFSVVAVESSFRVVAKSHRNARGLGQLTFATARAFNPQAVNRPDDLYDVHLNLDTALKFLKTTLARSGEDIRIALMVYYYGDSARAPGFEDRDQYVQKVMDVYDRLKERRRAMGV